MSLSAMPAARIAAIDSTSSMRRSVRLPARTAMEIMGELEAAIKALEAKSTRTEQEEQELEGKKERLAKLDIGFRVFKLDSSNIAAWTATAKATRAAVIYCFRGTAAWCDQWRKNQI